MKIFCLRLLNVILTTALVTSMLFMATGTTTSRVDNKLASGAEYDPWLDADDNGIINMLDLYYTAISYGATGDPTKNVNVTNWPTSHDKLIWWNHTLGPYSQAFSDEIHANGFGRLHVLARAVPITGQVSVAFVACLYNGTGTAFIQIFFYTLVLSSSDLGTSVTVDVPSDRFYFIAYTDASSSGTISLSCYLTWA